MLFVAGQDLVPGDEAEPADDGRHAFGRAGSQRNVLYVRLQQACIAFAQLGLQLAVAFEVRGGAPDCELCAQLLLGCVDRGAGNGAVRARVQVGGVFEHGKALAQEGDIHSGKINRRWCVTARAVASV